MFEFIKDGFYDTLLGLIEMLPDVPRLELPDGFHTALTTIFQFVGWLMPYSLYAPLIAFILGLTAFRIVFSIYMRFKKN